MFKTLFRFLLNNLAQRALSHAPQSAAPSPFPVRLNTDELKALVIRYVSFTALAILNFLLFVGGMVVTAVAIAHAHDVYHRFEATNVFWTGAVMTVTALVLMVVCGVVVAKTKVSLDDLLIRTPVPEPQGFQERLIRPLFEGIMAGLSAPRTRRHDHFTAEEGRGTPAA